jgi:deoxyribose-phosphate aldolase
MNIAEYIDHTLLKPEASENDIRAICQEAVKHRFASVCVAPTYAMLASTYYRTATVVGFPHGNQTIQAKLKTMTSTRSDEFDVVIDIGAIKSGSWTKVEEEIASVKNEASYASENKKPIIKYIVEVGYLTDEELFRVADLLIKYKIDFIKTCTGYGPRGVAVDDIVKIKNHVGNKIKIKASGGIKTYEFAKQLIDAGADRIGTSSSVAIVTGLEITTTKAGY